MSTRDLTKQRYEIAELINCPNELLSPITQVDNFLNFHDTRMPNVTWCVTLTKTGLIKKNSLRYAY